MLEWFLVFIATVLAVEIFLQTSLKKNIRELLRYTKRSGAVIASKKISDHWKEKVLPKYSLLILLNSLALLFYLFLAVSPLFIIDLIARQFDFHLLVKMMTPAGIGISILVATLYVKFRSQKQASADYSFLHKLLHYLALSSSSVLEATLDGELASCKAQLQEASGQHVFVSGLARAGTTILMRALYESKQFSSLTYADMPFVLAPNLWFKLTHNFRKNIAAKERAHGDGILVDYNSPEALDEVFWRTLEGRQYIAKDFVQPHASDDETIMKFRKYIAAILLRHGNKRYLSKNNNNILRIGSIHQAFPQAMILVPFRDPLQHANSLMMQHDLFVKKQTEDSFVNHYMSWLGHFEFGLSHKRFQALASSSQQSDTGLIDYWLEQWCNEYEYLLQESQKFPENLIFVSYELYCANTEQVWQNIQNILDLGHVSMPEMHEKRREVPVPGDNELLERAQRIYKLLSAESRERLLL